MGTRLATGASTGAIALRNSAQKSLAFSSSLTETGPRVRSLHRDLLRSVPWIKRAYGVSHTEGVRRRAKKNTRPCPSCPAHPASRTSIFTRAVSPAPRCVSQKMRELITSAFKDKQSTADVTTINRLIVMGRMELEETLMIWKGPSHVRSRPPTHYHGPAPSLPACFPVCGALRIHPVRTPLSNAALDPSAPQVNNWFDGQHTALKAKKSPKPAFLEAFLAGA